MLEGPFPPTLSSALDQSLMKNALTSVLVERFGSGAQITRLHLQHVERRIVRYEIEAAGVGETGPKQLRWIGKVYFRPQQFERGLALLQQLHQQGFSEHTDDGIGIPAPLGAVPEIQMVLMEEVQGRPFRKLIKKKQATTDQMRSMAKGLVKFQQCSIRRGEPLTLEKQLSTCQPDPETLAQAFPKQAPLIRDIVAGIKLASHDFNREDFVLVHGDFHPGQLMISGTTLWILDLDQAKIAEPAFDVAKLFTFLKRTGRKQKMADYVDALRDEFIRVYFPAMGWEVARRLPLYEALVNLKRACKCFRVQDEQGWEEKLERLIHQSTACLGLIQELPDRLNHAEVVNLYEAIPGSV